MSVPSFDLRLLPSFVAVAEEGHLGRAAGRLGITEHDLADRLDELEAQLGSLLVRSGPDVELTSAGELLMAAGRDIIDRADRARSATTEEHGSLTVHVGDDLNPRFARAVATFAAAHPGVRIDVVRGTLTDSTQAVLDGRADVGFDHLEGTPAGLGYAPVDRHPVGIAFAPDHRLVAHDPLAWTDLEGAALTVPPAGFARGFLAFLTAHLARFGVTASFVEGPVPGPGALDRRLAAGEAVMCPDFVVDHVEVPVCWRRLLPVVHVETGVTWNRERADATTLRFVRWVAATLSRASRAVEDSLPAEERPG